MFFLNLYDRLKSKLKKGGWAGLFITFRDRINNRFDSPGDFFRPTINEKHFLITLKEIIFFKRKLESKRKYKKLNLTNEGTLRMDSSKGYLHLPEGFLNYSSSLRKHILEKYNINYLLDNLSEVGENYPGIAGKRSPIINLVQDLYGDDLLLKYVTDASMLRIIARYLKSYPWLYSCDLWISNENENKTGTSQNFHMDWEDRKIVKVLFFLGDIDNETGPLSLIDAENTKKVINDLKSSYKKNIVSQRLSDEIVFNTVGEDKLFKAVGKKDDIFMVDTCNVLHYGSRKSSKPRLMLSCMYASPFSLNTWSKPKHRNKKPFPNQLNKKDWVVWD